MKKKFLLLAAASVFLSTESFSVLKKASQVGPSRGMSLGKSYEPHDSSLAHVVQIALMENQEIVAHMLTSAERNPIYSDLGTFDIQEGSIAGLAEDPEIDSSTGSITFTIDPRDSSPGTSVSTGFTMKYTPYKTSSGIIYGWVCESQAGLQDFGPGYAKQTQAGEDEVTKDLGFPFGNCMIELDDVTYTLGDVPD